MFGDMSEKANWMIFARQRFTSAGLLLKKHLKPDVPRFTTYAMILVFVVGFLAGVIVV